MLSVKDIEKMLIDISSGLKTPDDIFFKDCNYLLPVYKKLGVLSLSNTGETSPKELLVGSSKIYCNVPGCGLTFESTILYQSHFELTHRFICGFCRKSLHTSHLLDLHITEQHDFYFEARLLRGDCPMYSCFLEECTVKSTTPEERKSHCISNHKFPANYRFDQLSGLNEKQKKSRKKTSNTQKNKMKDDCVVETTSDGLKDLKEMKSFAFGHTKSKTFHTKNRKPNHKMDVDAPAVDNLEDMKNAINEV